MRGREVYRTTLFGLVAGVLRVGRSFPVSGARPRIDGGEAVAHDARQLLLVELAASFLEVYSLARRGSRAHIEYPASFVAGRHLCRYAKDASPRYHPDEEHPMRRNHRQARGRDRAGNPDPETGDRRDVSSEGMGHPAWRASAHLLHPQPEGRVEAAPEGRDCVGLETGMGATGLDGELRTSWFTSALPGCSGEGSCNFTTIGGVFELLGLAVRDGRGAYRKA